MSDSSVSENGRASILKGEEISGFISKQIAAPCFGMLAWISTEGDSPKDLAPQP